MSINHYNNQYIFQFNFFELDDEYNMCFGRLFIRRLHADKDIAYITWKYCYTMSNILRTIHCCKTNRKTQTKTRILFNTTKNNHTIIICQ